MALSAFDDKAHPPTPAAVRRVLGRAAGAWERIVAVIGEDHAPVVETWAHPGAKYGWSMRLVRGERIVVYLTPQAGCVLVGLTLGEKAVRAAREAGLPAAVMALVDAAPRYPEGRGVRLEVRSLRDVAAVRKLAAAKMA
jgi:hypothetical protein